MPPPKPRRIPHEQRIFYYALLAGLPGLIVAGSLLYAGDYTAKVEWTLGLIVVLCWLGFALALREQVIRPQGQRGPLFTIIGMSVVDAGHACTKTRNVIQDDLDNVRLDPEAGGMGGKGASEIMRRKMR